jgi:hypothetical protein
MFHPLKNRARAHLPPLKENYFCSLLPMLGMEKNPMPEGVLVVKEELVSNSLGF